MSYIHHVYRRGHLWYVIPFQHTQPVRCSCVNFRTQHVPVILVASGPFKLRGFHTDDQRVTINSEVLRDDHRTVGYLEAEVGNTIGLRLHMRRWEHPGFSS